MTSFNRDAFTGTAGTRVIVRRPWLGAFDLINFVTYTNVGLSLLSPGAFGEFQAAPGRACCSWPGAPDSLPK